MPIDADDDFVNWADGEDDDGGGLGDEFGALDWSAGEEGTEEGESPEDFSDGQDDNEDPGPQDPEAQQARRSSAPSRPIPPKKRGKKQSRAGRVFRAAKRAHKKFSPTARAYSAVFGVGNDPCPECGAEVTFDIFKTGKGYSAVLRIPTHQDRAVVLATSPSTTKAAATNKGVNMARSIASNKALQSIMPPQARLTMAALKHPAAKAVFKKVIR